MRSSSLAVILASCFLVPTSQAQTWCGKYYDPSKMPQAEAPAPGGAFPIPSVSQNPLLAFRCAAAFKPYLAEDANSSAAILIDSPVVYSNIQGAESITLPSGSLSNAGTLSVSVSVAGKVLGQGTVPLNASAYEIPFSLGSLTPQVTPYNISCQATYSGGGSSQVFSAISSLYFLPDPTNSSVTKIDFRTGALLAKPANGQGSYQPVFPIGFYTEFQYLANNLSVIDELAAQGFTIVHPIFETTPSQASVNAVFSRMQQKGLYFMYDMRYVYQDAANVTAQVNLFKSWSNLLVWYTGDEPDGFSDPLNATSIAYDLITSLDGNYHPVSLVLNCENYYFSDYAAGADVVMEDVYIVGANVNTSFVFDTPCTPAYGDCGCDNCLPIPAGLNDAVPPANASSSPVPANSGIGSFTDITDRVTSFLNRIQVMGWERTKVVWSVPQAFGGPGENYWVRPPTGPEWVVITLLGINHGSLGAVSWSDPTPADVKSNASALALALPQITPFLFDATAVRTNHIVGGVDVAVWSAPNQTLVVATNMYYVSQSVNWGNVSVNGTGASSVFSVGSALTSSGFTLDSMGSVAFVLPTSLSSLSGSSSPGGSSSSGARRMLVNGCAMLVVVITSVLFVS